MTRSSSPRLSCGERRSARMLCWQHSTVNYGTQPRRRVWSDGLISAPANLDRALRRREPDPCSVLRTAVKRVLRFLRFFLWGLIVVVALGGALFGYYGYTPAPQIPQLSGTLAKGSIEMGGLKRTYTTYVPRGLAKGAPLVVAMHGSLENGAQMRIATGYGFERLADEH